MTRPFISSPSRMSLWLRPVTQCAVSDAEQSGRVPQAHPVAVDDLDADIGALAAKLDDLACIVGNADAATTWANLGHPSLSPFNPTSTPTHLKLVRFSQF